MIASLNVTTIFLFSAHHCVVPLAKTMKNNNRINSLNMTHHLYKFACTKRKIKIFGFEKCKACSS